MKYELEKKYPPIKVKEKNLEYAKILLDSYAGFISEDTAVHQYIYNHIILKNINKDLSKAFFKVSITEMKHLDYLGDLIKLLGANPIFKTYDNLTNNLLPWNTNYLSYKTDVKSILKHSITIENIAINNYKKTINIIDDIYIKAVLNRIIEDELLHIKIFKSFLLAI